MKKTLLFILLSSMLIPVFSLEVYTDFHIGNLLLNDEHAITATTLDSSRYPWGINVSGSHMVADNVEISTGYMNDRILKNLIFTNILYKEQYFSIGVGPFFGAFNSTSPILNSGLSTYIEVGLPGLIFLEFRTDNSIGSRLVETGNYLQSRNEITFGFYVPNAICTINMHTKDYTTVTAGGEVKNSLAHYFFGTEIFQKNVPYTIDINFGYQSLTKTFYEKDTLDADADADTDELLIIAHTLGSVVVKTKLNLDITDYFGICLDVDSNIYAFGLRDVKTDTAVSSGVLSLPTQWPGNFLFNAALGFTLDIDALTQVIQNRNAE